MILLETNAPYLAPTPNRGKRNEPSYLLEIAKKIAEIRGESLLEVAEYTTANARQLYFDEKIFCKFIHKSEGNVIIKLG